jgi:hypothetical protein
VEKKMEKKSHKSHKKSRKKSKKSHKKSHKVKAGKKQHKVKKKIQKKPKKPHHLKHNKTKAKKSEGHATAEATTAIETTVAVSNAPNERWFKIGRLQAWKVQSKKMSHNGATKQEKHTAKKAWNAASQRIWNVVNAPAQPLQQVEASKQINADQKNRYNDGRRQAWKLKSNEMSQKGATLKEKRAAKQAWDTATQNIWKVVSKQTPEAPVMQQVQLNKKIKKQDDVASAKAPTQTAQLKQRLRATLMQEKSMKKAEKSVRSMMP